MARQTLEELPWDDLFVRTFAGDKSGSRTSRQLPGVSYAAVEPTPVAAPRLLCWSRQAGELLGLAEPSPRAPGAPDRAAEIAAAVLGGNRVLPGMRPYAAGYAGHQFGTFAGQLGDGRALTLGEALGPDGTRWEVQLKGAGPTPYSRRADGRAVLRSSIREFLCSEAMHHLGVPSTRALSLVATGETVVRDMFYDGRPRHEPGAIVCRLAPTFLRFGSFELPSWRDEHATLARLVGFAIEHHFPSLAAELAGTPDRTQIPPALVAAWYSEICRRTAELVAQWMRVGFVHGVMNTDNMSILGLTLDYGPYGWLDPFDPDFTPNTTDAATGRYRFGMQPQVAQWNLAQLARALLPLCPTPADRDALGAGLEHYRTTFQRAYAAHLLAKLGLSAVGLAATGRDQASDEALINDLLALLAAEETDFTLWFRSLAEVPLDASASDDARWTAVADAAYAAPSAGHRTRVLAWLRRYAERAAAEEPTARVERMTAANPVFLLRNYLVQQAIERAESSDPAHPDLTGVEALLVAARSARRAGPEHVGLLGKRPEWARDRPGCGALSCSS